MDPNFALLLVLSKELSRAGWFLLYEQVIQLFWGTELAVGVGNRK
ncbi:hypothetical protein CYB_0477 [Synechococcus sp. JA-2-3B'a(2-13)]|nr:hypothetical protein CYB_0477 [Synechococcus sp. JA-2-3B'a(2-13)]